MVKNPKATYVYKARNSKYILQARHWAVFCFNGQRKKWNGYFEKKTTCFLFQNNVVQFAIEVGITIPTARYLPTDSFCRINLHWQL